MSSKMGVTTLVAGMFLTGCANSLLSKYQDRECVENCEPSTVASPVRFEQPVWQTLNMFIGEFMCCIPIIWSYYNSKENTPSSPQTSAFNRVIARLLPGSSFRSHPAPDESSPLLRDAEFEEGRDNASETSSSKDLRGWRVCWMWLPAFFDICGTTLMNVGLILTPVSIYQMSRGALVLWVGLMSVIFLRRHLWLYQWSALIIVTLGVCLVGLSGSMISQAVQDPLGLVQTIAASPPEDPARVAGGIFLILIAQIFTASQYVVEEKIMSRYKVEPLRAVTLEGFFGLMTTLIAMPFLHIFLRDKSPYFDIPRGWHQIISTPTVLWSCVAIMFSIGSFNFFGLSVTHNVSATTRSTIDTCRTLGIWIVSLGLGWEALVWPLSLLQVSGFVMLVYGTFVFNGLLHPIIFPPPSGIRLPNEPELEQTGDVPAAGAQGRAGYDFVPEDERRG